MRTGKASVAWAGICSVAAAGILLACGSDNESSATRDTGTTAGAGGVGTESTSGGIGGTSTNSHAPPGFTVKSGLEFSVAPTCDWPAVPCNGKCAGLESESSGCQMVASSRIFTDLARDEQGTYFSLQGSGTSTIAQLDTSSVGLTSLAAPPGDNKHVHLSLGDSAIYFAYDETLYSIPRAGGAITQLRTDVPNDNQFVVVGQRAFFDVALDPELHELPLDGGEPIVHARDVTSMLRDGSDLYFAQEGAVYRAMGADLSAAQSLAVSPVDVLLGISGAWIYGTGLEGTERAVWRLPKAGGEAQKILPLTTSARAALAGDSIVFTQQAESFTYVCSVDLDGQSPTIHGYLPKASIPGILTASGDYIYVVIGFNMVRIAR